MPTVMKDKIHYVVILMLENRGFDHALGLLYGEHERPNKTIPVVPLDEPMFRGYYDIPEDARKQSVVLDGWRQDFPLKVGARAPNVPSTNPHEDYEHVSVQCFGKGAPVTPTQNAFPAATMDGFAQDFATQWDGVFSDARKYTSDVSEIVELYTPEQLPVLNGLAKHYAVSDMWFSSVPTQTNANRAYWLAGTSLGLARNGLYDSAMWPRMLKADDRFAGAYTLMNVLSDAGKEWRFYWHDGFPFESSGPYSKNLFPQLAEIEGVGANYRPMPQFWEDARNWDKVFKGKGVVFIEPSWGFAENYDKLQSKSLKRKQGNEYHPPGDTTVAELFVKRVYESLTANRALWEKTLFIVTYDEHGGTYDHVPTPWGAKPPWGNAPPSFPDLPEAQRQLLEYDFGFDRFGVRVPTILISPQVDKSVVFRSAGDVPYDHTSIAKTLCWWLDIDGSDPEKPGYLGERVLAAPTFEQVISATVPRTDDVSYGPKPARDAGATVKYGDAFRLQKVQDNPEYLVGSEPTLGWWYPRIGDDAADAVLLRFKPRDVRDANRPVVNGSKLMIESLEEHLGATATMRGQEKAKGNYVFYDAAGKEDELWTSLYWGYMCGDVNLQYGDPITLINEHFLAQRMTSSHDRYVVTKPAFQRWTIMKPVELRADRDAQVRIGDPFLLRNRNNQYFAAFVKEGIAREYYPTLGDRNQAVPLTFLAADGGNNAVPIDLGATLRLVSTEADLGAYNTLGAWRTSALYYYSTEQNRPEQQWKITYPGFVGQARLCYGDRLYLTSAAYTPQRLCRQGFPAAAARYLTTQLAVQEHWFVVKP